MNSGYGVYEVIGTRRYRNHDPGAVFEAHLDPDAEERAIRRGNIRLLRRVEPKLEEESFALPDDWPLPAADAATTEAPKGASLVSGGGKK